MIRRKRNCNPQKSYPCGASCQTNAHKGACWLNLRPEITEQLGHLSKYVLKKESGGSIDEAKAKASERYAMDKKKLLIDMEGDRNKWLSKNSKARENLLGPNDKYDKILSPAALKKIEELKADMGNRSNPRNWNKGLTDLYFNKLAQIIRDDATEDNRSNRIESPDVPDRKAVEKEKFIGGGDFSEVYRDGKGAVHKLYYDASKAEEKIARERKYLQKLEPLGIAPKYLGDRNGIFAMEDIPGKPLPGSGIKDKVVAVGYVKALRAMHGQGVSHNDLHKNNVIVVGKGDDRKVKIVDFGMAADNKLGVEMEIRNGFVFRNLWGNDWYGKAQLKRPVEALQKEFADGKKSVDEFYDELEKIVESAYDK